MENATCIIQTPTAQDSLAHLRNNNTSMQEFRHHADILSTELARYALLDRDLQEKKILTPLDYIDTHIISKSFIALPILRSGLAILTPFLKITHNTRVGFAGFARNEETAVAQEYYWKLPRIEKNDVIVVLDPMIATGGSMKSVLSKLRAAYDNEIRIVSIICAREGISAIRKDFPNELIITAAVDKKLNSQKYIVPGLGDFGNRYFGTE